MVELICLPEFAGKILVKERFQLERTELGQQVEVASGTGGDIFHQSPGCQRHRICDPRAGRGESIQQPGDELLRKLHGSSAGLCMLAAKLTSSGEMVVPGQRVKIPAGQISPHPPCGLEFLDGITFGGVCGGLGGRVIGNWV